MGSLITTVLIVYIFLGLFAWWGAEALIFQPPPSSYQDDDEHVKLQSGDETITAVHLANPDARYTLLFSHGNAEDIGHLSPLLKVIRSWGFSVFAYDYRGYGTSTGRPSEEGAYKDAEAAYRYLVEELDVQPEHIIAHGRSLGGATAVEIASQNPVGGLILESSFVSAYRVMTQWKLYPFDQFENLSKIDQVDSPVLVIHGKQDRVIPFWHGQKLFEQAPEPKQSLWVNTAGHNNLFQQAGDRYREALNQFISLIEQEQNL